MNKSTLANVKCYRFETDLSGSNIKISHSLGFSHNICPQNTKYITICLEYGYNYRNLFVCQSLSLAPPIVVLSSVVSAASSSGPASFEASTMAQQVNVFSTQA